MGAGAATVAQRFRLLELEAQAKQIAADDSSPDQPPGAGASAWPEQYVNSETGKAYAPHHEDELRWVEDNEHRYLLARGGEGGGKSVAGIVRDLNALKSGMSGIAVSPDFEHFKRSLWPELRRWIPAQVVIERERYRLKKEWEPRQPFELHFHNTADSLSTLYCGGIDDPTAWEGPNVGFAHFDEARRHDKPNALKTLDGRVRIVGPKGQRPQIWLTTTPKKHWLFDYFGPPIEDDPLASFKADSLTIKLLTSDNEAAGNLSEGFTRQRGQSLDEAERRVLLEAEWEDIDDVSHFLSSIIWWDVCREDLPALDANTPLYGALDGAYAENGDVFGFVVVSAHPTKPDHAAVRHVQAWEADGKEKRDFDEIEKEIVKFCQSFNVRELAYDPYQLHQMMTRLSNKRIVKTKEFNQGKDRLIADKQLLDLITEKRISHDGNPSLRKHLENADKKKAEDRKVRIVKRSDSLKIDLAVCLSMAVAGEGLFRKQQVESESYDSALADALMGRGL